MAVRPPVPFAQPEGKDPVLLHLDGFEQVGLESKPGVVAHQPRVSVDRHHADVLRLRHEQAKLTAVHAHGGTVCAESNDGRRSGQSPFDGGQPAGIDAGGQQRRLDQSRRYGGVERYGEAQHERAQRGEQKRPATHNVTAQADVARRSASARAPLQDAGGRLGAVADNLSFVACQVPPRRPLVVVRRWLARPARENAQSSTNTCRRSHRIGPALRKEISGRSMAHATPHAGCRPRAVSSLCPRGQSSTTAHVARLGKCRVIGRRHRNSPFGRGSDRLFHGEPTLRRQRPHREPHRFVALAHTGMARFRREP